MKLNLTIALVPALFIGCGGATPPSKPQQQASADSMAAAAAAAQKPAPTTDTPAPANTETPAPAKPAAVVLKDGEATLSPENTKIEFVGTHTGEKPDPRRGGFEKFSGKVSVDGDALKSISFQIDVESMWTEAGPKLTNHLKSPDFFDAKENPEIKFQSTMVETKDGATTVTGELTLHGVTKPITVPVNASVTKEGVSLTADFKIDRTEFGINYEPGRVEKAVSLTVVIGEKNQPNPGA